MSDGELREYEVEVNGNKTTMQLDAEDAARYGVAPTVAATPGEGEALVTSDTEKSRATQNKARRPGDNKSGA